jgi:hypothetical protein
MHFTKLKAISVQSYRHFCLKFSNFQICDYCESSINQFTPRSFSLNDRFLSDNKIGVEQQIEQYL